MAITEPVEDTLLTDANLGAAQALVAEAGWNQNHADWRIFLRLGRGLGARAADGTLVGTAAVLPWLGQHDYVPRAAVYADEFWCRGIVRRFTSDGFDSRV